jgi:hypothetical protein
LSTDPKRDVGGIGERRVRRIQIAGDEALFGDTGDGGKITGPRAGPMIGGCLRERSRERRWFRHEQVGVTISSDPSFPYNRKWICVVFCGFKSDFSKIDQVEREREKKKTYQHKYLACDSILSAKLPRSTSFFLS